MTRDLGVVVELWALRADDAGIWAAPGAEPWRSPRLDAATAPHQAVTALLREHGLLDASAVIHSTSWRADPGAVVLTYVAVARPDAASGATFPQLVDAAWAGSLAGGAGWGPAEAPVPRLGDVLIHALRHLRFLLGDDPVTAAALPDPWRRHLAALSPYVAGELKG